MTDKTEEAKRLPDAQLIAPESYCTSNYLDSQDYIGSVNFPSGRGDTPKRAVAPSQMNHMAPAANDSSESICRIDLPNDLIVSSPMKFSDILSLLLESPEKSSAPIPITGDIGAVIGHADAPIVNETGIYVNGLRPLSRQVSGIAPPFLRRSHSWHSDDVRSLRQQPYSGNADIAESLLLRRAKSLSDCHHYQQPTSAHPSFPPISMVAPAIDVLSDLYETIKADQQVRESPMVNVLGYSLPMVSVDGNSAAHVCITDVFQTFFSTRHWDEFKAILEKNGIQPVSATMLSNNNVFGMPDIVDAVNVNQVESLLLSNQARKDGFVRCLRLSMDGQKSGVDDSSATNMATESKLIMMPERQVGELSSGIRTRHADQSDIQYVELEGQTLPSIILNGVQFVRLVDVQQKLLTPFAPDDKPLKPSAVIALLAKQLHILKEACRRLNIDVSKCRPNEKARMVVYAHSGHSSSLHIVAAQELPRLVEFMRQEKFKPEKPTIKLKLSKRPKASGSTNGRNLFVSTAEDWSSDWSVSVSSSSGISPSSRPDSVNSRRSSTSSVSDVFAAPPSPMFELASKPIGTKRRATIDGRITADKKRQRPSSPVRINLDESISDDEQKFTGISSGTSFNNLATSGNDRDIIISTSKTTIAPCKIVVDHSPELPVIVYNRHGVRGEAGKYFDHLFVSKNAVCILCYGCREYFSLSDFLRHVHGRAASVPYPRLFMWVTSDDNANFVLWRSLVQKARRFNLTNAVSYDLPDNFGRNEQLDSSSDGAQSQSEKNLVKSGSGQSSKQIVLGGAPLPPPPPILRRRPPRGDAFIDVVERFSAADYKFPTPDVLGLHSEEHESEVDASYFA